MRPTYADVLSGVGSTSSHGGGFLFVCTRVLTLSSSSSFGKIREDENDFVPALRARVYNSAVPHMAHV